MVGFWQTLMITARMVGGPSSLKAIEEIGGELTKVIEEFVHAVDIEALRFTKRSGKNSLSRFRDNTSSVTSCRGARSFVPAA